MVFGVIWRKTGKKKAGENIPNPEMPVEYERKNIPYDFTEDCIAVMKIYEKVKQEERMAGYGCQAADKEI